jgi:L-alanine-DL-glutamate epimerase-like enolase superfamily enzyme
MKITGVRTRILSVPYRRSDVWSGGTNAGLTTVLVYVDTDEDISGIGEANGDRSAEAVAAAIRAMSPLLVDQDPFSVEAIVGAIFRTGKWHNVRPFANQAVVGIETALWDIIGQTCGQPIHNLWGGRLRDSVDFFYYLQQAEPEAMVAEAKQAVGAGYSVLYLKVGVDDDEDVRTVAEIRSAVGDKPKIRVDANEAWSPGAAVAMVERLRPLGIDFLEQPVNSRDLSGLRRVRALSPIPIAANQASFTHFDVLQVIRSEAADVIVTGPHQVGGLFQLKKVAAMCETAGLPLNRHAVGELGVGAVAGLHVMATIPNLTDGNQTHHQLLVDDVLADPVLEFHRGRMTVPSGPGLGIVLDDDKVDKYAALFERDGQYFNFPTRLGHR